MRTSTLMTLTALFTILLLAGCGSGDENGGQAAAGAGVGGEVGDLAPDFELERVAGGTLTLSSLRGKTVILDFWDTWCPPCRKALPDLQELSEKYADDLVVVGLAMAQEGEDKVRSFVRERGLTFEMVLFDQDPALIQAFGGIQSIPTTFLIDPEGVIRHRWIGAAPKAAYEAQVKKVLGAGPDA